MPAGQRDIPYPIMPGSAMKAGGRTRRGVGLASKVLVAHRVAEHRLACGRW